MNPTKKILLIEDEPQMRYNLATILRMENFQVFEAENGKQGLELALLHIPDLILCDIAMPEMDGYQVLEKVRINSQTASIPFIFITARGEKTDIRSGMNLGADDYITKPVSQLDLITAINIRLQRHAEHMPKAPHPEDLTPEMLRTLGLTRRESVVLYWVAQGKSNADICSILNMKLFTVKKHIENIFHKLGVENRTSAALRALDVLVKTEEKVALN